MATAAPRPSSTSAWYGAEEASAADDLRVPVVESRAPVGRSQAAPSRATPAASTTAFRPRRVMMGLKAGGAVYLRVRRGSTAGAGRVFENGGRGSCDRYPASSEASAS